MRNASLRMVLTAAIAALLTLALGASLLLVVLTTRLGRISADLGAAVESVRIVEQLQADLLAHSRAINRPRTGRSQNQYQAAERDLGVRLGEIRLYSSTAEEEVLIDRVERAVGTYLASQLEAERSGRAIAGVDAARQQLETAFEVLDGLVRMNVDQARVARERADRQARLAYVLGLSVAALLFVASAVLIRWIWGSALRPLFGLTRAIERFSRGDRSARAPRVGLWELRETFDRFNDMATALELERQAQLASLASIAHDLRNPLATLKTSAALARTRALSESPEQAVRTLEIVGRQVDMLERMVGDLLDEASIEAGQLKLDLERRDVRLLARQIVELYEATASRAIALRVCDEELPVVCDPVRIAQVLHNLLSNAIKYSPTTSGIEVDVKAVRGGACLAVRDHGIGIRSDDQARLFEPFHRTSGARALASGVGLGLSVSRRIVQAHGGRIEVASTPGDGATFSVFLPEAPPASAS